MRHKEHNKSVFIYYLKKQCMKFLFFKTQLLGKLKDKYWLGKYLPNLHPPNFFYPEFIKNIQNSIIRECNKTQWTKYSNRYCIKDNIQVTRWWYKYWIFFVTREMHIKPNRYNYNLIKISRKIKQETKRNSSWYTMPYNPAIPLLSIYQR